MNGQKQAIVSEISCRADGIRTGYLYGNGLSGQRVYDRQGRLLRQELGVRSAGTWSSKSWERHYQYDKNSNLVRRGPSPDESKRNYGYDALDRLEEERKAGPPEERQVYEYDLNGNQLREREKQEIEHFLENGSNRLLATEELLRTGEGGIEESSTSWRYEYNNAGRLKTVYQEGVKVSTYLYGADGLRRKKTVYETDGSTVAKEIHYHYVSGLLVSETTATGTLLRDYLWNQDGSPLAQIEGSTPGNSQEQLLYLHTDHLLTPRQATNATGTSVWSWESSAFGKESPRQDPDGDGTLTVVQLRYPGQYHDAETGLYYNWHRYYDPSTGRYIQSDPIGLQDGLNTYAYVGGNPLMYVDPLGFRASYCQRPLGDYSGKNGAGPPVLNHQFICVTLPDGKVRCDSTNNAELQEKWWHLLLPFPASPSRPDRDNEANSQCENIDDDKDRCFEDCVLDQWSKDKPNYAIGPFGTDCQEYSKDIVKICRAKCPLR